ncbi:uncharacterized protein BDR25DRAFT_188913, partial [Lindgomyces ingoldianus]
SRSRRKVSALLQLPGEIRNKIYEFALYEPAGIQYRYWTNRTHKKPIFFVDQKTSTEPQEFNQLKYVCGKLHTETAGIEIKFNNLIFLQQATWQNDAM